MRALLSIVLTTMLPGTGVAQRATCAERPEYQTLTFWVGAWDVFVAGQRAGTDRVESILGGCALVEHWTSTTGGQGQSLFYYEPTLERWQQVWVTTTPGAIKEKHLVVQFHDGAVRFQGEVLGADGRWVFDRTTLTPLPDGRVRQQIEVSTDGGSTWRTTFDAIYVRQGAPPER